MPDFQPLTILHIAAPSPVGGLESVMLELAGGLSRLGHRAVLVLVLPPGSDRHPVLVVGLERGIEVIRVEVRSRGYLSELRGLRSAIEAIRPDVVHTHGYRADLLGGLVARRADTPWISTGHGFAGGDLKNRFYEWLQIRSWGRADAVVAVSRTIRERMVLEGVSRDRTLVLPSAWAPKRLLDRVQARARLGIPEGQFTVGWVGRLSREKGADIFLDALADLREEPMAASIIGDGAERSALASQSAELGLGGRIRWHGMVPGASELLAAFDALVLSSRTEGTPIVLLEAVAAGVPVVATAVGGIPDMFHPSDLLLVPSENPVRIAEGLRAIRQDPAAAISRAAAARKTLYTRFELDAWLRAHVALYTRLRDRGKVRS